MDATAFTLGLIVEPGTDDLNVGCKLSIAPIYITPLPLGLATMTLGVPLCVTESQQQQLQRAGQEPVCLVPGSVDKYLHVPESALQLRLNTHSETFLLY